MAPRPNAIGRRAPLAPPSEDMRDPAGGERVPRCNRCGMPERPESKLLPGLWSYIRYSLLLTLCERCIRELAPPDPRLGDPLTLDEVA